MSPLKPILPAMWVVLLFLAPAIRAGDVNNPELTDASGDAPAQVDVVAAWFGPSLPGELPSTTVREVDCEYVEECQPAFRIYVRMADTLLESQPLTDSDPSSTRWLTSITFTASSWGDPITIHCMTNYADLGRSGFNPGVTRTLGQVGRLCYYPQTEGVTGPFAIHNMGVVRTENSVRTGDTYFITLLQHEAPVVPGMTLGDLEIRTTIGGVQTSAPLFGYARAGDVAGPGGSFTL